MAAKIPFMADFVWAGSAEVILNGGGIASVMSSREWLDYLREVTGTAELHSGSGTTLPAGAWKYDAVIVATGLHDLHERVTGRISVESALDEYRQHLSSFLQLLSPLAPNRVFLSINHVIHPCDPSMRFIHAINPCDQIQKSPRKSVYPSCSYRQKSVPKKTDAKKHTLLLWPFRDSIHP